jgi:biopolymer transport protein ExbB
LLTRRILVAVLAAIACSVVVPRGLGQQPPEAAGPPAVSPTAPGPAPITAAASPAAPSAAGGASSEPQGWTTWQIINAGGAVGLVIILLSIAAVALVIEHALMLRPKVLMPPGLADEVRGLLSGGRTAQAAELCQTRPSFLSSVLSSGIAEVEGGWPAVEKAVEDSLAEHTARLVRKVEYLSVIANIAPMLGLLGTVMGMIVAFRQVAETQGAARAADLAEGIYLALVTTVEGLVVAIPTLGALAVLRNRLDQLVAEAANMAELAFLPLKRGRPAAVPPARAPSPPPVGGTR